MLFDERIINYEFKLNDTDDSIISYLQKNRLQIHTISIKKMAEELYVAPNSITRLSHKLGYDGVSELKIALKNENQNRVTEDNDQKSLLNKTFELIDHEREEKIIRHFLAAKRIIFFAVGQTAYPTKIYVKSFQILDGKSVFYTYQHEVLYENESDDKKVFVLVSLSGETEQLVKIAKAVKNKNHTLISITTLSDNSLQKLADFSLFCYSPVKILKGYNITDKAPLLVTLNSLFEKYQQYV